MLNKNLARVHKVWRAKRATAATLVLIQFFRETSGCIGMELAHALKKKQATITAFQRRWRDYALWKEASIVSRVHELEGLIREYGRGWERDDMAAPREFMALWEAECPEFEFNIADPPFCDQVSLRKVLYKHWTRSRQRFGAELEAYRGGFKQAYLRYEKEVNLIRARKLVTGSSGQSVQPVLEVPPRPEYKVAIGEPGALKTLLIQAIRLMFETRLGSTGAHSIPCLVAVAVGMTWGGGVDAGWALGAQWILALQYFQLH